MFEEDPTDSGSGEPTGTAAPDAAVTDDSIVQTAEPAPTEATATTVATEEPTASAGEEPPPAPAEGAGGEAPAEATPVAAEEGALSLEDTQPIVTEGGSEDSTPTAG